LSHSESASNRDALEHEMLAGLREEWVATRHPDQRRRSIFAHLEQNADEDRRQDLMRFAGKYVRASGTVYERKGTHAIAINEMVEMNNVYLNTEDQ
jgi:hypothetical protein